MQRARAAAEAMIETGEEGCGEGKELGVSVER